MGVAIGWLMCNRQGLSIVVVPDYSINTGVNRSVRAYERLSSFVGDPPLIDLNLLAIQANNSH
jgi:aromatic ring-cleaving dioxygenase